MRPLSDSFTAILSLNSNFTSLVNSVPLLLSKYVSKTSSRSPNFHVLPSIVDDTIHPSLLMTSSPHYHLYL